MTADASCRDIAGTAASQNKPMLKRLIANTTDTKESKTDMGYSLPVLLFIDAIKAFSSSPAANHSMSERKY